MSNDVFRKKYQPLSDGQKSSVLEIKEMAEKLLTLLNEFENADKRYMALAKTALEESVMWAVKSII